MRLRQQRGKGKLRARLGAVLEVGVWVMGRFFS